MVRFCSPHPVRSIVIEIAVANVNSKMVRFIVRAFAVKLISFPSSQFSGEFHYVKFFWVKIGLSNG